MRELSVFIDESGDFGPLEPHSPYYIIALVFHDQASGISEQISVLEKRVREAGFQGGHNIHTAPLIRRERDYSSLEMAPRRRLFRSLFEFVRHCDVSYEAFLFRKREFAGHDQMVSRISREVGSFVRGNLAFFQSYDRVIVYYDNGQKEVTNIINSVFNVFLDAEVRKVSPSDYALFQAADMVCTVELLAEKSAAKALSRSEDDFFGGRRNLKKNYLGPLARKRFAPPG